MSATVKRGLAVGAVIAVASLLPTAATAGGSAVAPPSPRTGATVATVLFPTPVMSRPAGGRRIWRAPTTTETNGSPLRLMVLTSMFAGDGREWLKVQLPIRPVGRTGWILADHTSKARVRYYVKISRRLRTVVVYRNGRVVKRARAVVGAPATPTPRGRYAIYETVRQANPTEFIGPWALHLTALSNVLFEFAGGTGRVAIHGRGPSSIASDPLGSAASHGCVRINNGPITWMAANLPTGTPVEIGA